MRVYIQQELLDTKELSVGPAEGSLQRKEANGKGTLMKKSCRGFTTGLTEHRQFSICSR